MDARLLRAKRLGHSVATLGLPRAAPRLIQRDPCEGTLDLDYGTVVDNIDYSSFINPPGQGAVVSDPVAAGTAAHLIIQAADSNAEAEYQIPHAQKPIDLPLSEGNLATAQEEISSGSVNAERGTGFADLVYGKGVVEIKPEGSYAQGLREAAWYVMWANHECGGGFGLGTEHEGGSLTLDDDTWRPSEEEFAQTNDPGADLRLYLDAADGVFTYRYVFEDE